MIELTMTRAEAMRRQRGLLVRELAEMVGTSRCNMNMKLTGHGGMRREPLRRMAEALDWDGEPEALLEQVTLREVGL